MQGQVLRGHVIAKASPSKKVYIVRKQGKVYVVRFHAGVPHIVEKTS
jgi:hypothetical protein